MIPRRMQRVRTYCAAYLPENPETQHLYVNPTHHLKVGGARAMARHLSENRVESSRGRYLVVSQEWTVEELIGEEPPPLTEFGEQLMGTPGSFPHFPWMPQEGQNEPETADRPARPADRRDAGPAGDARADAGDDRAA